MDRLEQNVIRQWLHREGVPQMLRGELQGRIDFIQAGGPESVPGCIAPVPKSGGEFYTLTAQRKGVAPIRVVFCYGPFSDREMTLLVGVPDKTSDIFRPVDALRQARLNLADLLRSPAERKRYERVT